MVLRIMHQLAAKFAWEQKFDKTLSEIHFSENLR